MSLVQVQRVIGRAIHNQVNRTAFELLVRDFPGLSPAEREDLLAIPQQSLRAYQSDHYSAEENMLAWGFTTSFFALEQLGFGTDSGSETSREFVLRFRRSHPPLSHSVREMAELFVEFVKEDLASLVSSHPWLLELAEMERLEIQSLYGADKPGGHIQKQDIAALFEKTVEELFLVELMPADGLHLMHPRHDLALIKSHLLELMEEDKTLDPKLSLFAPLAQTTSMAVARHLEGLEPRWFDLDENEALVLGWAQKQDRLSTEALIETWVQTREDREGAVALPSEDILLAQALSQLSTWLKRRYFLLAGDDSG
ncbi:MAG: hypothetical protein JRF33_24950 [Deltaproteobacteria bacterium]|nr:hypothetical protein [Deltaproteobacteria bacterium]